VRRADGRDIDAMLHVDPTRQRALLSVYNPLDREVARELKVPLRYAGITGHASVRQAVAPADPSGPADRHAVDAERILRLPVRAPARSLVFALIE